MDYLFFVFYELHRRDIGKKDILENVHMGLAVFLIGIYFSSFIVLRKMLDVGLRDMVSLSSAFSDTHILKYSLAFAFISSFELLFYYRFKRKNRYLEVISRYSSSVIPDYIKYWMTYASFFIIAALGVIIARMIS